MGSFIFGYRLFSLLTKINRGNLDKMFISISRDKIQNEISIMTDSIDNAKTNWSTLTSNALSQALSTYNSTIGGLNNNSQLKSLQDQLAKAGAAGTDTTAINDQINTLTNDINKKSQEAYTKYQNFQTMYSQANQTTNSVFEEAQKRQLKCLNDKDLALEKKQKKLEGQVLAWEKERDNVEKARDEAIGKETVKFGVA